MTFWQSEKNRIAELHNTYNEKRSSSKLEKADSQGPLFQAFDDINSFKEKLPDRKDFAEIATELFTIFKKHQIDIGKTVYKPESVDINGLYKYTTSLSIKGTYTAVKELMADIQESRTLFCIEDLSISSNEVEGSVEMKVKIATFFR